MTEGGDEDCLLREAERIARRHVPAYVVVGPDREVRYFSEGAGRYVHPPAGVPSLGLVSLVHHDLASPLGAALARAAETGAAVALDRVALRPESGAEAGPSGPSAVAVVVEPVPTGTGYVVLFRDGAAEGLPAAEWTDGGREEQAAGRRLKEELRHTREQLQSSIEDLGHSNEELRAANEEQQAANAELMAANAELEASRQELQAANADLKNLLESTQIATVLLDENLRVRAFTAAAAGVFHLVATDVGRPLGEIASRLPYPEVEDDVGRVLRGAAATVEREIGAEPDGLRFHARVLPYRTLDGRAAGAVLTFLDVTETTRARAELMAAEASLRQAQKMDALGQLTGGIAHDFNNMLQAIGGSLELMRRRLEHGKVEEAGRFADGAHETVGRAAALTHRLLAFARHQQLRPAPVHPDALVEGMAELIRRTVGPGIAVELNLGDGAWPVLCDPNQLESALLNLAVNARDAMLMEGSGRLTIATRHVRLSGATELAELAGQEGARPGDYVEIAVADTGAGMDEATKSRAFEPFFTTKPLGQGTGLGLSQLYGFVRQSGGVVRLDSALSRGTTVRLYLPRHEPTAPAAEEREATGEDGRGRVAGLAALVPTATEPVVLLVEDEATGRMVAAEHLRGLGYTVLEAGSGAEAMALLDERPAQGSGGAEITALVTDVGLPGGLNGRQVAEMARERRPGLPVLFITGYAGEALREHLPPGTAVLGKPFTLGALAAEIRAVAGHTADED